MTLFRFGFLAFQLRDLVDVSLVALIAYQLYRLVRGSLAINIAIGLFTLYLVYLAVDALHLTLLTRILGRFVDVGVLAVVIIFQPELRRFLLMVGRNTTLLRPGKSLRRLMAAQNAGENDRQLFEVSKAVYRMAASKTGALIVFRTGDSLAEVEATGEPLDANITSVLIESIFNKKSPLHDGAVVVRNGRLSAAGCVLPTAADPNRRLPQNYGMRHRAALGITEATDAVVVLVSEQTGKVAISQNGHLMHDQEESAFIANLSTALYRGT